MKFTLEFPQVMKMFLTTNIEIPDSASLKEVKGSVFKSFLEPFNAYFTSRIGTHGTIEDITVKDPEIEILTEDILKDLVKTWKLLPSGF